MKYGLIGEKLGHSFSKPIHEKLGGYTYELKEIKKEDLDSFMKKKEFSGINVTIPYKSAVIPYLDYIDEKARKIGAVNTIVNKNGSLFGYNTDFGGMKMLIEKAEFNFKDKKILIAGTGGTSKTAAAVSASLGAREIITVGRKGEVNYENVYDLHSDADYVINTTPLGMYPDCESYALSLERFENLKGVTDVVYNPLKTRLCQESEQLSVKAVSGLYMLVAQAVLAYELFSGKKLQTGDVADEIFKEIFDEKENIVLIGMPGSGKTTIGTELSEDIKKPFIDTDDVIREKYGEPSEIINEKGEGFFRDIEEEVIKEVAYKNGVIIATGGGAILREANIRRLKQNGKVIFLDRPLDDIAPTDDRPLSKNRGELEKRYYERYDLYRKYADERITVDGYVEHSVLKIKELT